MQSDANMAGKQRNRKLEAELAKLLSSVMSDITVEVAHNDRWNRMCVTFRTSVFTGLLPEERFQRLVQIIPEEIRSEKLAGHIWLELAPDETIDAFLKYPRSEDIEGQEEQIYTELSKLKFFGSLGKALGESGQKSCPGDFSVTTKVLLKAGASKDVVEQAKLLFVSKGAYCDCQIVLTIEKELAEQFA